MNEFLKEKYGDWALITGASSGIGKEFAKVFAKCGINLILAARREEHLEQIKNELTENYQVIVKNIITDLSTINGIQRVIDYADNYKIGILVNNAGFGEPGKFANMGTRTIERMICVNCTNYAILTNHISAKMIENRKGAIFIISSIVANIPVPYMSLYSATKAFDLALGESLWYEMKKYKIDVCTVCPGSTETEFKGLRSRGKSSNVRSVSQVVNTAINSIGTKAVVTDGYLNKFNTFLTRLVPRSFRIKASGKIASNILDQ